MAILSLADKYLVAHLVSLEDGRLLLSDGTTVEVRHAP